MHLSTVSEWMSWIESIHATEIDLGLERVKMVAERLGVLTPKCPVIIVGGTNGKGSTVSGLEAIYRAAGYQTGAFTSPILFRQNEQVRINGNLAKDEEFCEAFAKVESARGGISLTPFEYCTLGALCIFQNYPLDIMILEVGMGGRLDAVNILNADVAVVASVGIDHISWLGHTRELIGREKAGIFRAERPAVCGDFDPPVSLIEAAADLPAPLYFHGRDFDFEETTDHWTWTHQGIRYESLPLNSLSTQNMSVVLMVITLLQAKLPVKREAIDKGLKEVTLPGRIQIIADDVTEIFDVSHNPDAVAFLKQKLDTMMCTGRTLAVFSMLSDKDIIGSLTVIKDRIDEWYAASLQTKRSSTMELLEESFAAAEISQVRFFSTLAEAYQAAIQSARMGDRVIVFGSFHAVAEAWRARKE
ncbi:Bifunctional protein FolC [Aquicella siphonis]|uniref:Dihydrofolate synthase/folylpolyglutamate synthase n=1 Tax=Aquicella siphonis TaxID=254247 RepID=A0A5E4PEE0_9COXI|nr:bifunctional tetrahydrofolate synthase/dihydrofolate synthase [Aquicella siphonis]VVC74731.1 Bifunctional protein FolC [Aquicella siphonis]